MAWLRAFLLLMLGISPESTVVMYRKSVSSNGRESNNTWGISSVVERPLCMRKVGDSISPFSIFFVSLSFFAPAITFDTSSAVCCFCMHLGFL